MLTERVELVVDVGGLEEVVEASHAAEVFEEAIQARFVRPSGDGREAWGRRRQPRLVRTPAMRRACFLLVPLLLVAACVLAGCGESRDEGHVAPGVFAVTEGMTKAQVRKIAGKPRRVGPRCWTYRASEKGTSIDAMSFCFTNGRVSLIQRGHHL
jgi:hypothetical protein